MSKKTRQLILILIVLVVIGGGTALLLLLPKGGSGEGDTSSAAVSSATEATYILEHESADISSVLVENPEGSYTILPSEDASTFTIEGYDGAPLNNDAISAAARIMATLTALRDFGETSDLGQYGLENPQTKLTATYKDGTKQTLLIGDLLPGASANYYVMVEGSNQVFSASISAGAFVNSLDYVNTEILNELATDSSGNQETADFGSIVLSGTNYPEPITIKTNTSTDIADPLNLANYLITEPERLGLNDNFVNDTLPYLSSLTADEAVCVNPTQEDLEKYGLADPKAVASYTMNDKEYKLMVGNTDENGTYLMKDGVNVIYLVKDESMVAWANQTLFTLRSNLIHLINIEVVSKLTVKTPDGEYVFERSRTLNEEKTSSLGKDTYDFTTTYNGTELETDNFGHYYQTIIGLLKESPVEDGTVTSNEPDVRVEFEYFPDYNKENTVIELYPASDRRYLYRLDGEDIVLVKSSLVERLIDSTQKVINGEEVVVN